MLDFGLHAGRSTVTTMWFSPNSRGLRVRGLHRYFSTYRSANTLHSPVHAKAEGTILGKQSASFNDLSTSLHS